MTEQGPDARLTLSAVIPTRGRSARLGPLIARLLADPDVLEVVVVVDGADDRSSRALQSLADADPRLRVLQAPRQEGAALARHRGVEAARGDVVLLLDDDVLPGQGLAAGHLAAHEGRPDAVVIGAMPTARPSRRTVASVTTELYAQEYDEQREAWVAGQQDVLLRLWGGHLSLLRKTASRVGPGDPVMSLLYFEDRELGLRLRASGAQGVFCPHLAAAHLHRRSLRAFLEDARRQGAGLRRLHELHPAQSPEPVPEAVAGTLRGLPRQMVLLAARQRHLAHLGGILLLQCCRGAGLLHRWTLQRRLLVLMRHVGQAETAAGTRLVLRQSA